MQNKCINNSWHNVGTIYLKLEHSSHVVAAFQLNDNEYLLSCASSEESLVWNKQMCVFKHRALDQLTPAHKSAEYCYDVYFAQFMWTVTKSVFVFSVTNFKKRTPLLSQRIQASKNLLQSTDFCSGCAGNCTEW